MDDDDLAILDRAVHVLRQVLAGVGIGRFDGHACSFLSLLFETLRLNYSVFLALCALLVDYLDGSHNIFFVVTLRMELLHTNVLGLPVLMGLLIHSCAPFSNLFNTAYRRALIRQMPF